MQCPECRQHPLEPGQQVCWWCRPTTVADLEAGARLPEPTWAPKAGVTLRGTWKLLNRLGAGGMGFVWLAEEPALGRTVAIKFLSDRLCTEELAVKRFWREARIAAAVEHPYIVPIYAVGEEGGWPYLVMKYVSGQNLADVISEQGKLPLEEARPLLQKLASGVDALHARGVIHRDLKPANVIVGVDQHPWIVDFGISSALSTAPLTQVKGVVGTAQYVAPEVISGGSEAARGTADQYSFAVMAYQLLTGKLPFVGENTLHELQVKQKAELAPPSTLGLPAVVDAPFVRALRPSPDERFENVSAFAAALEGDAPKRAKPPRWPIAAVAGFVLLAGVGAWQLKSDPPPVPAPAPAPAPMPAEEREPTVDVQPGELELEPTAKRPRPSPKKPPAPAPAGLAEVRVITVVDGQPSWGNVMVDGKPSGTSPTLLQLQPGKHRIRAERPGYSAAERAVTVSGGANPVVELKLRR